MHYHLPVSPQKVFEKIIMSPFISNILRIGAFPQVGVKTKKMSCHHLEMHQQSHHVTIVHCLSMASRCRLLNLKGFFFHNFWSNKTRSTKKKAKQLSMLKNTHQWINLWWVCWHARLSPHTWCIYKEMRSHEIFKYLLQLHWLRFYPTTYDPCSRYNTPSILRIDVYFIRNEQKKMRRSWGHCLLRGQMVGTTG